MFNLDHDPELPAGTRDADLEMAEFDRLGRRYSVLKRRGVCAHGWIQGPPGKPAITCLDCGQTFASDAEWHAEHKAILNGDR